MKTYKRKQTTHEAAQWNKSGDHIQVVDNGGEVTFRFDKCKLCGKHSKDHGYILHSVRGGLVVCPGSWIVSYGDSFKVYSDEEFQDKYEVV